MKALETAVHVARRLGLAVDEPVLLRSTNNVVAWLRPSMIVAKIGAGYPRGFHTEVKVASELSALGAPVVPPAPECPVVVHAHRGFAVTFWRYCPQPSDIDIPGERMAAALHSLHAACAKISIELRAELPSYLEELRSVSDLLHDDKRLLALPVVDRRFLIRALEHLWTRVQVGSRVELHAVIHGSPHPYNVLLVDRQPRFIDFETTCIGPVEWDLAHMAPDGAGCYAGTVDAELLKTCRDLVRVKTSAWCWADVRRGDLRHHAEMHLAYLKKRFVALRPD